MNKIQLKYCKVVMAFMLLLCSIGVDANIIKVDGIYYECYGVNEASVTSSQGEGYSNLKGHVVIPETIVDRYGNTYNVVGLDRYCFSGCEGITDITLPNSITSLYEDCFKGCSSLTSVTIPDGVTSLGEECFYGCSSLTSIDLPNGITSLGARSFCDCSSLTSINLPNSITSFGEECFYGCSSLTSIDLPNGVTSLGKRCFRGCSSLTSINLPNSITSFGEECFEYCSSLTSINLPNGITSLGARSFSGCTALANITIPVSVTSFGVQCFYGCSSLTSVTIPNGVTSMGDCCFKGCSGLTSINLPNSITSLGEECFKDCSGLTSINLPNVITSLELSCFENCTSLTNITFPSNITNLGERCFYDCSSLTSVTIPDGVISMGDNCFSGCSGLTDVNIPGSIASLGKYCFTSCINLTSLKLNEGLKDIPNGFCGGCPKLSQMRFPSTIQGIGRYAFSNLSDTPTPVYTFLSIEPPALGYAAFSDNVKFFVPEGSVDKYKNRGWNNVYAGIPISSVSLPNEQTLECGEKRKIQFEILPEDATNKNLQFRSNNSKVASVDENCVVTAIAKGYATIVVSTTDGTELEKRIDICVTDVKVKNIELPKEKEMYIGEKWPVEYTVLPDAAANKAISYSVDNEDVVNVYYDSNDKLVAQAKKSGTANVTLTSKDGSDISATCSITVKAAELNLSTKTVNLQQGGTYAEQKITTNISGVGVEKVTWASTDPNVASIDAKGMITANKPGIATIRYTFKDDESVYADCKVVVYAKSVAYIGGICYLLDKNKLEATVTNVYGGDNTSVDAQQVAQSYSGEVNVPASTFYEDKRYTVTKVGSYAFSSQNELHSVFLPSTITSIQGYAFYKCSSLDNFDMPNTVQSLGGYAFAGCASLTDIHLSTSLGTIGQYSFSECGLSQITLPESLKSINACAFRNNEHLQKVQLSESMESIGDYAFSNNAGLKEISFPKKLQSIGVSAFENNPALEAVIFNTEVENMSIGKNAFNQCPILNKVYITNLTNFAQTNFGNAKANPANTSQHIYDASEREIKNVVLASGIRFINNDAFNGCAYIESVEIPSTLEYIKDNIFKGCSHLRDVYCYATEVPPFVGSQDPSEMDDVFKAATLHVIYGNEAAYKRDSWWGRFSQVVGCNTPIPDPVKVESITLNQTEATLKPDESIQLTALVNPDNADNKNITWTSTNEDVAMVSADGFVLAIAAGATNIVAEAADGSGVKAICKVTVEENKVKLSKINFVNSAVTIGQGNSSTLAVNFYPENATNKQLAWSSARPAVATVDDNGIVTALVEGKTIITAKSTDGSGLSTNCVVTVIPSTGIGNITMGDVKLIIKDRHLKVEGLADNDIVQIINTIGFTVYKGTEHEIDLKAAGVYIVKVKGKTLKFSVK